MPRSASARAVGPVVLTGYPAGQFAGSLSASRD
jgi:CRP-like cAMP-binding protein